MVLIDSSVWIEYWRTADSEVSRKVRKLIRDKEVCITAIILTEILQGARTLEEMDYIKTILAGIPRLPLDEEIFLKAAELSFNLKRTGKTINTIDSVIAAAAFLNNAEVFTLDEHFKLIQKVAPLKLTAK